MEPEGRWIILMLLFGALLGVTFNGVIEYGYPGAGYGVAIICSSFMIALLMGPTYSEVEEHWRKKHGS